MGITDITWEEYETFTKVETPDNLYIREHNGTYYTVFELGIASVRRIFDIKAADFNAYMSGKYSADDLLFKAQNDSWPPKVAQLEANKNFWRRYPDVLKSNVKAQKYFTKKELEEILPEGSEILASSDS